MALGGEGAGQDRRVDVAALEALARFERRDGHLGRAEQHAVDGVEVALHRGEDVGEGLAIVLGLEARQLVGERLGRLRRTDTKSCTRPP